MFIKSLLVSSIVAKTLPSTDGKFFTVKYQKSNSGFGDHYVQTSVTSQTGDYDLYLTSQNSHLAMVHCAGCNVPHYIETAHMNPVKDDSLSRIHVKEIDFKLKDHEKYYGIKPKSLEGANWYNGLNLNDTTVDKLKLFAVDHTIGGSFAYSDYNSKFDGFIGIAPPDSDSHHVQDSFLWQLKDKGAIQHQIVGMTEERIQFGGYDPDSILAGYDLDMYETTSIKSWNLKADRFHFGQTEIRASKGRLISFEPQVEYVYVPEADWFQFRAKILKMTQHNPECSSQDLLCKFRLPCDALDIYDDFDLKISIYDSSQRSDITIDGRDLLIDGNIFGDDSTSGACYVGIQKQTHLSKSLWTIGNVILKKYTLVFDATPHDERGKNFIQVGLAPRNPDYEDKFLPPPPPPPPKPVEPVEPEEPEQPIDQDDDDDTTTTPDEQPDDDHHDDDVKPKDDDVVPETKDEIADERFSADPVLDLFLNNISVILFFISFEVMQFFKTNILGLFKK